MNKNKNFKKVVVSSLIAVPMLVAVQSNTFSVDTAYSQECPAIVRVVGTETVNLLPEYILSKPGNAIDIELARAGNAIDIELA